MKQETIEKARKIDSEYFGDIPLDQSLAIIASQISSMKGLQSEVNVMEQSGDLLFSLISLARNQQWDLDKLLINAVSKIETRQNNRHYYEAHITIEPVFEDRLVAFKELCKNQKFHVANLFMQKRKEDTEIRSKNDAFCTGRSISYTDIEERMFELVKSLERNNFKVWRYKIESTLLDSRYNDEKYQLDKDSLPDKEKNPRAPAERAESGRV